MSSHPDRPVALCLTSPASQSCRTDARATSAASLVVAHVGQACRVDGIRLDRNGPLWSIHDQTVALCIHKGPRCFDRVVDDVHHFLRLPAQLNPAPHNSRRIKKIVDQPWSYNWNTEYSWSPDGRYVAYAKRIAAGPFNIWITSRAMCRTWRCMISLARRARASSICGDSRM